MSTDLETRVYNNYRASLRTQTGPRAAVRRQAARKATVERYNIAYALVKDIVARGDEKHGITHDHTPDYLALLQIERAQADYDLHPIPCTRCGNTETVRVRYDPFAYEIEGVLRLTVHCFECHLFLEAEI